jgi:hypothetical protein
VVGVVGVVGADGVVPDPLPDPLSPSLFGQSARVPVPFWRGVWVPDPSDPAEPSDGAVVLGDVDGSGLAADTTAAAPPTSRSPEIAAVRIARRTPELVERGSGAVEPTVGGAPAAGLGAGTTGGVVHSIRVSFVWDAWPGMNPDSDPADDP